MTDHSRPMRIAVLMTCHNRREKTLQCLRSLRLQSGERFNPTIWLVDDGGTDGTSEAVKSEFPDARLIRGDGNLFWCGGMRLAWCHAAEEAPDAYLWLNDDVTIDPDTIPRMVGISERNPDAIVIGSCRSPETGEHTYGGQRRLGRHPGRVTDVPPSDEIQACDTFQGNLVLIPAAVFAKVGNMAEYRHAMADTDYGYQAVKKGFRILIAPGYCGTCPGNPGDQAWRDKSLPLRERFARVVSLKGLPPADWWRFCSRHGGLLAPLYFASPYLKVLLSR